MSAMIWQGCERLVSPLMTGTVALAASSRSSVVVEDADHDRVDIARQHPGGVGDGLAAAELHLAAGQHDRLAAELAHADVEGDAGARRGLARRSSRAILPASGRSAGGSPLRRRGLEGAGRCVEDGRAARAPEKSARSRKCRGASSSGSRLRARSMLGFEGAAQAAVDAGRTASRDLRRRR